MCGSTYQIFGFIDIDRTDNGERFLCLVIERPGFIHLRFQPVSDAPMFAFKRGCDSPAGIYSNLRK